MACLHLLTRYHKTDEQMSTQEVSHLQANHLGSTPCWKCIIILSPVSLMSTVQANTLTQSSALVKREGRVWEMLIPKVVGVLGQDAE